MAVKKRRATGEQLHDLFHEVFVLHDILFDVADEVHARAGLRTAQCTVADELERLGSATVPDVAAALNVSRQFVQTTCNELERIGVVRFSDSPRHKRSKLVSLTEAGRRTLARAAGIEAAVIEKALPDMDAAAVSKAQALLRDIRERVQATTRDRWG